MGKYKTVALSRGTKVELAFGWISRVWIPASWTATWQLTVKK